MMNDKKKYIMFLGGTLLGMVLMGVVICFTISKVKLIDKTEQINVNSSNNKEVIAEKNSSNNETVKKEEKVEVSEKKENNTSNNQVKEQTPKKNASSQSTTVKKSVEVPKVSNDIIKSQEAVDDTSENIINYFEKLDNKVFTDENIAKFTKSVKTSFITITDFIFYGTEINGHTFNELTEQAKLYVMDIAVRIDAKIEAYHPGYKEEINTNLTNLKNKITVKYLEVSNNICTRMGDVACNQAKEDFQTMKQNFGLTVDFFKVIARSGLNSLKSWYEIFRENNR